MAEWYVTCEDKTGQPLTLSPFFFSFSQGSFFAGVYALFHWGKIFKTDHSTGRKFLLLIEVIYLSIQWLFSWFALVRHACQPPIHSLFFLG